MTLLYCLKTEKSTVCYLYEQKYKSIGFLLETEKRQIPLFSQY